MDKVQDYITDITARLPDFDAQAVLFALIAGWITGWVWYFLVDRAWKAATKGIDGDAQVPRTQIRAAIAQVIMTVMLAIVIQKFGGGTVKTGISIAVMMWFGFVVTTMMVNHSHLGAPLSLTIIDGIHWFLVLVVMGAIIGAIGTSSNKATSAASEPAAITAPAPSAVEGTTPTSTDSETTAGSAGN